jgi:hypothetical protein
MKKLVLLMALTALTVSLMASAAWAGKPVVHGIVSQGYLKSSEYNYLIPSEQGSFAFNEVLLNVSATVSGNLRVGAQMMARNYGSQGNEDMVLDWAFGDYRFSDAFGVRIGKVKTPYGLYNQTRDVDMVRTAILLPQSVYTERYRDVMNGFEGIGIYGNLSVGSSSVEYEGILGTVDMERTSFFENLILNPAFTQIYGSPLPTFDFRTEAKSVYGGALRWNTPLEGLRVGGTVMAAEMDGSGLQVAPFGAFRPDVSLKVNTWYVLSAEYTRDALMLAFEFNRLDADILLSGVTVPTGMAPPAPATVEIEVEDGDKRGGWYGMGTYQVSDKVQLGGYYAKYYPDYNVREGEGFDYYQNDLALTLRYDVTDYWLFKLEGHFMSGTGDVQTGDNPGVDRTEENWNLFGVKSTFYF